jgi:hypothetical protein
VSSTVVDPLGLSIGIVSLIITLGMATYGARLLYITRKGKLEKSWKLASTGSIFLTLGVLTFAIEAIYSFPPGLRMFYYAGGVCMIIGGSLLLFGFRSQYGILRPPRASYEKEDEKLGDLA